MDTAEKVNENAAILTNTASASVVIKSTKGCLKDSTACDIPKKTVNAIV